MFGHVLYLGIVTICGIFWNGLQLLLLFVVYVLYLEGNKLDGTIPVGCWPISGFLFDVRDAMAGVSQGPNLNTAEINCWTD